MEKVKELLHKALAYVKGQISKEDALLAVKRMGMVLALMLVISLLLQIMVMGDFNAQLKSTGNELKEFMPGATYRANINLFDLHGYLIGLPQVVKFDGDLGDEMNSLRISGHIALVWGLILLSAALFAVKKIVKGPMGQKELVLNSLVYTAFTFIIALLSRNVIGVDGGSIFLEASVRLVIGPRLFLLFIYMPILMYTLQYIIEYFSGNPLPLAKVEADYHFVTKVVVLIMAYGLLTGLLIMISEWGLYQQGNIWYLLALFPNFLLYGLSVLFGGSIAMTFASFGGELSIFTRSLNGVEANSFLYSLALGLIAITAILHLFVLIYKRKEDRARRILTEGAIITFLVGLLLYFSSISLRFSGDLESASAGLNSIIGLPFDFSFSEVFRFGPTLLLPLIVLFILYAGLHGLLKVMKVDLPSKYLRREVVLGIVIFATVLMGVNGFTETEGTIVEGEDSNTYLNLEQGRFLGGLGHDRYLVGQWGFGGEDLYLVDGAKGTARPYDLNQEELLHVGQGYLLKHDYDAFYLLDAEGLQIDRLDREERFELMKGMEYTLLVNDEVYLLSDKGFEELEEVKDVLLFFQDHYLVYQDKDDYFVYDLKTRAAEAISQETFLQLNENYGYRFEENEGQVEVYTYEDELLATIPGGQEYLIQPAELVLMGRHERTYIYSNGDQVVIPKTYRILQQQENLILVQHEDTLGVYEIEKESGQWRLLSPLLKNAVVREAQ